MQEILIFNYFNKLDFDSKILILIDWLKCGIVALQFKQ